MKRIPLTELFLLVVSFCLLSHVVFAQKKLKTKKTGKTQTIINTSKNVSDREVSGGLKEALSNGITKAVKELNRDGGFLDNDRVRIPLPKQLQTIEKGLRLAGQGKTADDFVETMNHAAEKAVGEAIPIFAEALKQMTFADARNILTSGEKDSATQFFRRTSEDKLREKFLPVVKRFTDETGVTAQYKQITAKAGFLGSLAGKNNKLDIDEYITDKALDGLFLLIAEEEKNIRDNPLGRTTDLLRKVFGIGKK